jgi:hypothetical protein
MHERRGMAQWEGFKDVVLGWLKLASELSG